MRRIGRIDSILAVEWNKNVVCSRSRMVGLTVFWFTTSRTAAATGSGHAPTGGSPPPHHDPVGDRPAHRQDARSLLGDPEITGLASAPTGRPHKTRTARDVADVGPDCGMKLDQMRADVKTHGYPTCSNRQEACRCDWSEAEHEPGCPHYRGPLDTAHNRASKASA